MVSTGLPSSDTMYEEGKVARIAMVDTVTRIRPTPPDGGGAAHWTSMPKELVAAESMRALEFVLA